MDKQFLNKKVKSNLFDRLVYSRDASFYRYVPEEVAFPEHITDIKKLIYYARESGKSITFRAAGTSLSGQALTDSILADIRKGWREVTVHENGQYIEAGVSVIGAMLNSKLKTFGRYFGPDPASLASCTVGGILANNSSGMSSGIDKNPYNTMERIEFILPSGTRINTADNDAPQKLLHLEPGIIQGIESIREDIVKSAALSEKIRKSYEVKNTIGYSLNAFIDYTSPLDILSHLMIGSEGTLGFICKAKFRTFALKQYKITILVIFKSEKEACEALNAIFPLSPAAMEIIDGTCLDSIRENPGIPVIVRSLLLNDTALLIEFKEESQEVLDGKESKFKKIISGLKSKSKLIFSTNPIEQANIWKVRSGLLTSVSAKRLPGTSILIEDICVRRKDLAKAFYGLNELFDKNGFKGTGIYGHGLDGNLHFILPVDVNDESEINNYSRFMHELAEFVIDDLEGSLKAEHGTGRNMAPFVRKQWGEDAYDIIRRIKKLIDPDNIFNPGVIINDDERIHLKNIKNIPVLGSKADECIECGFCESVCPSRDFTITPRQRILALREKSILNGSPDFEFNFLDSCATDGLCELKCPVDINTGNIVKEKRAVETKNENKLADFVAGNIGITQSLLKIGIPAIKIAEKLGLDFFQKKQSTQNGSQLPDINRISYKSSKIKKQYFDKPDVAYFPCCTSRLMGGDTNGYDIISSMINISRKAGINLNISTESNNNCCGMAFHSKGYTKSYEKCSQRFRDHVFEITNEGKIPLVMDSGSCTSFVKEKGCIQNTRIKVVDSVEFISEFIIDNIKQKPIPKTLYHPNCSFRKSGNNSSLNKIIQKYSYHICIPENPECCGAAGDKAIILPGLSDSALLNYSELMNTNGVELIISTNIPCEMAIYNYTGKRVMSLPVFIDIYSE